MLLGYLQTANTCWKTDGGQMSTDDAEQDIIIHSWTDIPAKFDKH